MKGKEKVYVSIMESVKLEQKWNSREKMSFRPQGWRKSLW